MRFNRVTKHHLPTDLFDCTLHDVLEFFAFSIEDLGFFVKFHAHF